MRRIVIISVGQKHLPELEPLINDYVSRLPRSLKIDWRLIKHEAGDAKTSVSRESEKILSHIPERTNIILLDETGSQIDNKQLTDNIFSSTRDITFIIGGAYGVSEEVKAKADFIWSLSKLVLPHQIVRLVLVEQIYRSYAINNGHPYHHS